MRLALFALLLAACGGSASPNDFSISGDIALPVVSKCIGVVACAAGCDTSDCVASCEVPADPGSISAYEALVSCAQSACAASDGGTDGGVLTCGPSDTACSTCVDQTVHGKTDPCTAEFAACLG